VSSVVGAADVVMEMSGIVVIVYLAFREEVAASMLETVWCGRYGCCWRE
jgi:hypothetical protein